MLQMEKMGHHSPMGWGPLMVDRRGLGGISNLFFFQVVVYLLHKPTNIG